MDTNEENHTEKQVNEIVEQPMTSSGIQEPGKERDQKPSKINSKNKGAKQEAVRQKIEKYFHRLTQGCQRENCSNPNCASNPDHGKMSGNEAAVKAIQLFQKKAQICEVKSNNDKDIRLQTGGSEYAIRSEDYKESAFSSSSGIPMDTSAVEPQTATVLTAATMPDISQGEDIALSADMKNSIPKKIPTSTSRSGLKQDAGNKKKDPVIHVKEIKYLTEEMVDDLLEKCRKDEESREIRNSSNEKQDTKDPFLPLVRIIGEVFSNMEGLNRSFLSKRDVLSSPKTPEGLDTENHPSEEMKMDVDPPSELVEAVKDTESPGKSNDATKPSASSQSSPFMDMWNSLLDETRSVDNAPIMTTSATPDGNLMITRTGESSGLHRAGAIRKKWHGDRANRTTQPVTVLPPTIDLEAVRRVYQKLARIESIERALVSSLEILSIHANIHLNVLPGLHKQSNIVHNLNMFLIVMENPELQSPEYLEKGLPSFCHVMGSLPLKARAALARIWSKFGSDRLLHMVQTLQHLLTFKLITLESSAAESDLSKDDAVTSAVKCLEILYYASLLGGELDLDKETSGAQKKASSSDHSFSVSSLWEGVEDDLSIFGSKYRRWDHLSEELKVSHNDCSKPLIPLKEFENELLNMEFDAYDDFTRFVADENVEHQFTFMHYPFILNTVNKSTYLFYDNRIRMLSGRRMMVLHSILNGSAVSPYLRLRIRRDHVIDDSLVRLEMIAEENPMDLRKQLYVEFEGEQGVDEGGVSKEFFQLVVEQIFNPDYGMFTYNDTTNLFWFSAHSFENKAQFTLIGIVLGLAIYNNCILDVKFPPLVYKKLFGKKAQFEDMKDSHPALYHGLKQLLEYDGDVENDMMATFSVEYSDMFGITHSHVLKTDGADIAVTKQNREEYVKLYADWLLNESISEQFGAFHRGFELVVSHSPLKRMFRPDELEVLICGSHEYDFNKLESTTEYDGGFTKTSQTVLDFWTVVHEMSGEDKRKLLQFTTGTDRAPVGGLSQIKLVVARNGPDSDRLPTAHTCFNVILLPDYKNREKLTERLYKAINYSKGFGML